MKALAITFPKPKENPLHQSNRCQGHPSEGAKYSLEGASAGLDYWKWLGCNDPLSLVVDKSRPEASILSIGPSANIEVSNPWFPGHGEEANDTFALWAHWDHVARCISYLE